MFGSIGKAIGGFLGGGETGNSSSTVTPWGPQGAQLQHLFNQGRQVLDQRLAEDPGQLVAQFSPTRSNQVADNFINGQMGQINAAGLNAINGLQFGSDIANQGASGAMSLAQNMPQNVANNISLFTQNADLDGAIDAVSRDVTRNLNENTLTGIRTHADTSGNVNSSRAGIAEGIARRGAQDRVGDIAATMRSNAYNNALDASQSVANSQMQTMLGSASAGLGASNNLASMMGALTGTAQTGQQMGLTADQASRQANQSIIDNEQAQLNYDQVQLENFLKLVGGQQFGSSTSGETTSGQDGAIVGNLLGLGLAGAGLFGG